MTAAVDSDAANFSMLWPCDFRATPWFVLGVADGSAVLVMVEPARWCGANVWDVVIL